MSRVRVSTTVDPELWASVRAARPGGSHAQILDAALRSLLEDHRRAEIDEAYDRAYRAHPVDEGDAWGDLRSFGEAVRAR